MSYCVNDLIAAIASPLGRGERGIVRLSGTGVRAAVSQVFRPQCSKSWLTAQRPQRHLGVVPVGLHETPLPVAVYLWPTERSYTGQPSAEIHTLAALPLLNDVLTRLCRAGARFARPGEYTLRAFLAGRMDLLQAEAVLAVIDANDQQQLQHALSQLAGGISHEIANIREALLIDLADLEAGLDFADEDLDFVSRERFIERLSTGITFLDRLLNTAETRLQSGSRFKVLLAGQPNAGKSTLFNALVGQQAAIVSDVAGTTRDYLTANVAWADAEITLVDTAGHEATELPVMRQAQELRTDQWQRADLVLWCSSVSGQTLQQREQDEQLWQAALPAAIPARRVWTKCDTDLRSSVNSESVDFQLRVSSQTGAGLDDLRYLLGTLCLHNAGGRNELLGSTSARCRESLEQARTALRLALEAAQAGAGDELTSLELRSALDHLGRVAGQVSTDDILDRIFSRFCIGK